MGKFMWKALKAMLKLGTIALLLGAVAGLAIYLYLYQTVGRNPNRVNIKYALEDQMVVSKILFADGSPVCEVGLEKRIPVPVSRISPRLIKAILATEDDQFYSHDGVIKKAIVRAGIRNGLRKLHISKGVKQGASTITQQIVKNLLLTSEQTMKRKVEEYFLAQELEDYVLKLNKGDKKKAKDQLLGVYLNYINFGHGRFGVEAASWYHFGHSASEMSWLEAFALAAIPKSPTKYNPRTDKGAKENASRRRILAYRAYHDLHWLTGEEYDQVAKGKLVLGPSQMATGARSQWICDNGKRLLEKAYCPALNAKDGESRDECDVRLSRLGVAVQTGIRKDAQEAALGYLEGALKAVAARHPLLNKLASEKRAKQKKPENVVSGTLIAIDNATGNVIALAMAPYGPGSQNLAMAPQVPGSTMKPIVYAAGFRMGLMTPETVFIDDEAHLDPHDSEKIWPLNYEPEHLGAITVRYALAESVNTVAVKAIMEIGAANVITVARELGITSKLDNERSLALGVSAIPPLEMAGAYATFARGGEYIQPRVYTAIGQKGIAPVRRRVFSFQVNGEINDVTRAVIEEGTGRKVKGKLPVVAYGKTGTTSNHSDALFVLYTADYTLLGWVGHSVRQSLGNKETGAAAALPMVLDLASFLYTGKPAGAVYAMPTKPIVDYQVIDLDDPDLAGLVPEGAAADGQELETVRAEDLPTAEPVPGDGTEIYDTSGNLYDTSGQQ